MKTQLFITHTLTAQYKQITTTTLNSLIISYIQYTSF